MTYFCLFDCISETFIPQIYDLGKFGDLYIFQSKKMDIWWLTRAEDMGNTYQEQKVQHRKGTVLAPQQ